MNVSQCKHLRIITVKSSENEISQLIEELESKLKDFKSLPKLKEIIQQLHTAKTYYENKIHDAAHREYDIIKKLYIQSTRPSPFELTEKYVRTAHLWEKLRDTKREEQKCKRRAAEIDLKENVNYEIADIDIKTGTHPNTEIDVKGQKSMELFYAKEKEINAKISTLFNLPIEGATKSNLISPLGDYSPLSYGKNPSDENLDTKSENGRQNKGDNIYVDHLKYNPEKVIITKNNTKLQVFKIQLLNIISKCLCVQFKNIADSIYFQDIKCQPKIPVKIYPGLSAVFKLSVKLKRNVDNILSGLNFKVSCVNEAAYGKFCIPIVSDFIKKRCIIVTESVFIPPVYLWHLKRNPPKSALKICVKDDFCYNLHSRKISYDICDNKYGTDEVNVLNIDRNLTEENSTLSNDDHKVENIDTFSVGSFVLETAIERALDTFILKPTFLRLAPRSQRFLFVYFCKADHPGFYQTTYDLEFYDTDTEKIIMTKKVKVFAEIRSHPLKIEPIILDMSYSAAVHGYLKDTFIIHNCHSVLPFHILIKTTKKMKKLFHVTPTDIFVSANSSVTFNVSTCIHTESPLESVEEKAYFTIKINIKNNDSLFENIPPIFYEIIIPCAQEFKRIYKINKHNDCD